MTTTPRKNVVIYVGGLLIALGLVASATILQRTVLPEGTIEPGSRRGVALSCCRIVLIGLGAVLLWRRPRVTMVHLCAFALMGLISGIFSALLLQLLFVPPRIVCGWRSFAPAAEQNELGFRGHPINYSPEDFVIVLLGDSQVEAISMPLEAMPEQCLESHLKALGKRVRVVSLGAAGYGQDQELLVLEEYLQKYRANLVILWQTPSNDVWNNLFNTHMFNRNPKPTFWLEAGTLRGPSEAMGQPLANSPIVVAALCQRIFALPRRDNDWERHLPEAYSPYEHHEGPVNREWQERWNVNRGRMRDENLATEKSHMAVLLSPPSQRMKYGLALTRALTLRIQQIVDSHGGKLAIFQVDAPVFSSEEDETYVLNGKYYRVSKRQSVANWDYVNQGFDTEIVPVTLKNWRVGPEDGHLNREATDQVIGDLAQRLQRLIPDKIP